MASNIDYSTTPLIKPPPGQTSNFINPKNYLGVNLGVSIPLIVIAVTFSCMNVFDHRHRLGCAEAFLVLALIFALAYTSLVYSVSTRLRHSWDMPISIVASSSYLQDQFAQDILVGPSYFFAKGFILALYLSIFRVKNSFRVCVYIGFVWTALCYWPQIIFAPIFCAPRPGKPWDSVSASSCQRETYWGIVQSVLGLILDIYLFCLPIPIVWNLNMSKKKKLSVTGIFGTASLGILASIMSLVYRIKLLFGDDVIWYSGAVLACNLVELWIAIIVGNMPGVAARLQYVLIDSAPMTTVRIRLVSILRSVNPSSKSSSRGGGGNSSRHRQGVDGESDKSWVSPDASHRFPPERIGGKRERERGELANTLASGHNETYGNTQFTSSVVSYPGKVFSHELPDDGLLRTVQIEQTAEREEDDEVGSDKRGTSFGSSTTV